MLTSRGQIIGFTVLLYACASGNFGISKKDTGSITDMRARDEKLIFTKWRPYNHGLL